MRDRTDDMLGRVCVVVGGGDGVGKEIARGLALKRATVIVAADEAARAVGEEISDDTANPAVTFAAVDVASGASVRALTDVVRANEAVHVLVIALDDVVAAFRVARALAPLLEAGAPSRIVNVAHRDARGRDVRMLTWALADRMRKKRVTANAVHPGIGGDGFRGAIARAWSAIVGVPPARAAMSAVWLASSRALESDSSEFYVERRVVRTPDHDDAAIEALWSRCEAASP
jgi:NAD(P)-dependent dehydrogenase (short-subunit alcohol dehydrogenase family)